VAIVALLVGIANSVSMWVMNPVKAAKERHEELKDETAESLKKHDRRIQRLEDADKHMPTRDDLHKLALQMETLTTKLGGLETTVGWTGT
jgi:hypothetical protein